MCTTTDGQEAVTFAIDARREYDQCPHRSRRDRGDVL